MTDDRGDHQGRDPACDLCTAARITPWYHEDECCWVAECEICAVPMVVWRRHHPAPPPTVRDHLHAVLGQVVRDRFGGGFWIDDRMRNIPGHYHAHARPQGRFMGPWPRSR